MPRHLSYTTNIYFTKLEEQIPWLRSDCAAGARKRLLSTASSWLTAAIPVTAALSRRSAPTIPASPPPRSRLTLIAQRNGSKPALSPLIRSARCSRKLTYSDGRGQRTQRKGSAALYRQKPGGKP